MDEVVQSEVRNFILKEAPHLTGRASAHQFEMACGNCGATTGLLELRPDCSAEEQYPGISKWHEQHLNCKKEKRNGE